MTCSCSRSPPFRTVRELSTLFIVLPPLYPLYPCHTIDHHLGEKVLRPALHHLGWPWLRTPSASDYPWNARGIVTVHFITFEVDPGLAFFFSSFSPSSLTLPPLWPPPRLESKVIQIQSDHLLAASPPVAAMERSKVTCSIQVC